jgi:hypothetical protein
MSGLVMSGQVMSDYYIFVHVTACYFRLAVVM